MNPIESLGTVEEATRTRMFEERKDKARKDHGKERGAHRRNYGPARRGNDPEAGHPPRGASCLQAILKGQRRTRVPYTCPARVRMNRPPRQGRAQGSPDRRTGTQVDQARREKERATREVGVADKDRVDVRIRRDGELRKGGKVTRMEEEAREFGKVMIKSCTQAEIKEGTTKDEEAPREASGLELSEVRPSSFFSYRFFYVG
jgi:structural maintenance of chromosome 2